MKGNVVEPHHRKSNKVAFAPSEGGDQPRLSASLISLHEESLGP